jgi:hypothetical protein
MRNRPDTIKKNDQLVKVLIIRADSKSDMDRYIYNIKLYASMENVSITVSQQEGGDTA